MRKRQRIIYSSITGMLVCAFVLMAVIMVKNSKTVSALNLSDAMQMDTYNKLHEIKDTDTNGVADWLYSQALDTLESNGVSLTGADKDKLKTVILNKVLELDSQGLIQYEDGSLTSLAKGYLANITTEAVAEVQPDALDVAADGYTQVYDYSAIQEQVAANRDSVTKLAQELQTLETSLNGTDGKDGKDGKDGENGKNGEKYTTVEELNKMYESLQTIIKTSSHVSNDKLSSKDTVKDVEKDSDILSTLQASGALPDEEYTKVVHNIVNVVEEVKKTQTTVLTEYSTKVKELETQLKAMSTADSSLSAELNTIKGSLASASGSVSTVESSMNSLSDKLMADLNTTNSNVNSMNSSLEKLKESVSKDSSDTANKITDVVSQLETLSKDNNAKSEDLISKYDELYSLVGELDTEAFKDKEDMYKELTNSISELSNLTTSERVAMYEELTQSIADLKDLSETERTTMYEELTASIASISSTNTEERVAMYEELSQSISDLGNLSEAERNAMYEELTTSIATVSSASTEERVAMYEELSQSISELGNLSEAERTAMYEELTTSIATVSSTSAEERMELYTELNNSISNLNTLSANERNALEQRLTESITDLSNVSEEKREALYNELSASIASLGEEASQARDELNTALTKAIEKAAKDEAELRTNADKELSKKLDINTNDINTLKQFSTDTTAELSDINTSIATINNKLAEAIASLEDANDQLSASYGTTLVNVTSDLVDYMESMQTAITGNSDAISQDVNNIWVSLNAYTKKLGKFDQDITLSDGWSITPEVDNPATVTIDLAPYGVTYEQLANVDVHFSATSAPMTVEVSGSESTLTLTVKPVESRFDGKSAKIKTVTISVPGSTNELQDATPSAPGLTFDEYSGSTGAVTNGSNEQSTGYKAEEGVVHQ